MFRTLFRIGLRLGVVAGLAFVLVKVLGSRDELAAAPAGGSPEPWPRLSTPTTAWVDPTDGVCPTSHPVKAKLASQIFHLPGMRNYERTNPDRCYADVENAEADGLRAAKA